MFSLILTLTNPKLLRFSVMNIRNMHVTTIATITNATTTTSIEIKYNKVELSGNI